MAVYGGWNYGAGKYNIGSIDAQATIQVESLFVSNSVEKIKDASAQISSTSIGSLYGQGTYGSGQFGNRYANAIRIREASATIQSSSQIESVAYATKGVSALIQSASSASATAVFDVVASATVQGESNATATANRLQKASALISDSSSMIVVARKKWENEADTPETWTVIEDTPEIWTRV